MKNWAWNSAQVIFFSFDIWISWQAVFNLNFNTRPSLHPHFHFKPLQQSSRRLTRHLRYLSFFYCLFCSEQFKAICPSHGILSFWRSGWIRCQSVWRAWDASAWSSSCYLPVTCEKRARVIQKSNTRGHQPWKQGRHYQHDQSIYPALQIWQVEKLEI